MEGHTHHAHSMHESDGSMDSMPMYFIFNTHTTLWFKSWETKTLNQYITALVALVVFGVLHEALVSLRCKHQAETQPTGDAARRSFPLTHKLWAAGLLAVHLLISYLLMLAVMTFNVGFFAAVIVGMTAGYFVFYERMSPSARAFSDCCNVSV